MIANNSQKEFIKSKLFHLRKEDIGTNQTLEALCIQLGLIYADVRKVTKGLSLNS